LIVALVAFLCVALVAKLGVAEEKDTAKQVKMIKRVSFLAHKQG
jgi:hypothetical protein